MSETAHSAPFGVAGIVIGIILFVLLWLAFGALCTWLAGKLLQREELTFPTSFGLTLLYWAANPLVPFVLFFWDYYIGLPPFLTSLTGTDRSIYLGLFSTVLSVILWLLLYKYLFGWDIGQSCTFCFAQGCAGLVLVATVLIIVVIAALAIGQ